MGNIDQGTGSTQTGLADYRTISGGLNNETDSEGATVSGGTNNRARGENSYAEGVGCEASGNDGAHAEGTGSIASGDSSHAEGDGTIALGPRSHAEGQQSEAAGRNSHAEGQSCLAQGPNSHAEGEDTIAWGLRSHAGGYSCKAFGEASFVQGDFAIAGATDSISFGDRAVTTRIGQLALANSIADPVYGMPGDAQCSWLPLKGKIVRDPDDNNIPRTAYLTAADGSNGFSVAEDGKAYAVRVRAIVAGVVSETGDYSQGHFVAGQRLAATVTLESTFRVTKGAVKEVGTPHVSVQGDNGTQNWALAVGDSSVIQFNLPQTNDPPVNCKIAALVEFQEVVFPDFAPDEVNGITLWLQPDPNWTNNTALGSWSDSSGQGNHFEQTQTAAPDHRPRTKTAGQNGSTYVEFDGSMQFLRQQAGKDLGNLIDGSGYTIFVVAKWLTKTGVDPDDPRLNDMMIADTAGTVGFGLYDLGPAQETLSYLDDGVTALNAAKSYALDSQPLVFHTAFREGYLYASTAGGNGDKASAIKGPFGNVGSTAGVVRLAVNTDGSAFANLAVYEVIVYNRGLNVGERMNIVGYLSAKYQLSTN
jgi:hypothetical protein